MSENFTAVVRKMFDVKRKVGAIEEQITQNKVKLNKVLISGKIAEAEELQEKLRAAQAKLEFYAKKYQKLELTFKREFKQLRIKK